MASSASSGRRARSAVDLAILIPDLRVGGVERQSLLIARELVGQGVTVDLVLHRAEGPLLDDVPPGVQLEALSAPRFRQSFVPLVRYLRRRRPRAVLARMWPVTSLAVWARALGSPATRVVTSDHNHMTATWPGRPGWPRRTMAASMRASYPLADAVVAVSRGAADDLAALAGLSRSRVEVVYNPVTPLAPTGDIDRQAIATWLNGSGPRLVSVGTLKAQKDYPTLLRALARLRRQHPHACLLVVGDGPERGAIGEMVRELGLEDAIVMAGMRRNPHAYVACADVFVLSSRYEGFGNVLVEALAVGTPVVSTRCPSGPSEILDEGRFGRLVPVGSESALAEAITETIAAPPEAEALRARAEDFSIAAATAAYRRLAGL